MRATPTSPGSRFRRWSVALATAALLVAAPSVMAAPGDLTSYAVPPGTPFGVAVAPDGDIWFTLRSAGVVAELDADTGTVSPVSLPDAASDPTAVTVGTDGSVWVTLQAGNAIARLVTRDDGLVEVVEHVLPGDGSGPAAIAAAPDGSVWFTERFGNRIGRVSVDGELSEWDVPVTGPSGIAVADDGTVWFSTQSSSKLGRFDPETERFRVVDLPPASQPAGVALDGIDGVWVTLRAADAVARVDASTGDVGVVALTPGGRPSGVALGADGALWVAETAAGRLTRVDPVSRDVVAVALGGSTGPQNVASDPAGFVWVAESAAGRLSSLELPLDAIPPTIELRSPGAGDWTAPGRPLIADYACADDGGSGVATCAGPVASGAAVAADAPGAHPFEVVAVDGAGNTTTASAAYLSFTSVDGSALGPSARAGAGLTLSLGMDLAPKTDPGLVGTTTWVDCGTGAVLGPSDPAALRERVTNHGTLELRWLTSRTWEGTCRTLTLGFAIEGWTGATADVGPVAFSPDAAATAKR